jgi:hypothetical protein
MNNDPGQIPKRISVFKPKEKELLPTRTKQYLLVEQAK